MVNAMKWHLPFVWFGLVRFGWVVNLTTAINRHKSQTNAALASYCPFALFLSTISINLYLFSLVK